MKDVVDRTGIFRIVGQLQQEQYLPEAEIQELRRQRLTALLTHARARSPYYRDVLATIRIPSGTGFRVDDLSMLPVLTRERLQLEGHRILCEGSSDHYPDASGGSTGRPVHFFHDEEYRSWGKANQILHNSWMGIRPGDRTAIFWGADRDLSDDSLRARLLARVERVRTLNSFRMTEERIGAFLEELDKERPRFIYGYASSLYHIASFIKSHKPLSFRPAAVKSSAEMLFDFQRREIEEAFGAPVFNFYGSREVNNVAAECPAHDGLHVFESGRIVEVVDEEGRPVPPGQVGSIAVTDLTNRAFPFIRYMNGDLASEMTGACSCGRTYKRLEKIVGRSSDIIRVGGRQIHGEYFTHLFYENRTIKEFQLVQESEQDFTLVVVPLHDTVDLTHFREQLKKELGPQVRLDTRISDHIPPGPGGKHRFTISKLEPARDRGRRERESKGGSGATDPRTHVEDSEKYSVPKDGIIDP